MLGEPPTEEELTLIRGEGENGAILKVALAFGFNLPPDIGALLSSMGRGMSIWEQQSGCLQTLVSIWRYVLGSVSMTGSPHNEELIQGLESLLSQGRERTHAATALLRLGKPLPGDSRIETESSSQTSHSVGSIAVSGQTQGAKTHNA